MEEKKYCKFCGEQIEKDSIVCPKCGRQLVLIDKEKIEKELKKQEEKGKIEEIKKEQRKDKPKFYTLSWFMWLTLILFAPVGIYLMWQYHPEIKKELKIVLSVLFSAFFLYALISQPEETTTSSNNEKTPSVKQTENVKVEVVDFSMMTESDALNWCNNNNLKCIFKKDYSATIVKDGYIKQSVAAMSKVNQNSKIVITYSLGKKPTIGQQNALKKAKTYSDYMHMSKSGIYQQLVSEYGEGFTEEEAQYAMDNLIADWNKNALEKAKSYQKTMSMSKAAIYEQLTSEYGEGFTVEEAQYAIDHLEE